MFLQASVILLTGGYLTPRSRHAPPEQTPREQTPPGADIPPSQHAVRYGQRAGGTHPTGMQPCLDLG